MACKHDLVHVERFEPCLSPLPSPPPVLLATLNARYAHASMGLRSLLANLGAPLREQTRLCEFTVKQSTAEICDALLGEPAVRIIGLGVYIWNVAASTDVVRELKRRRPDVRVILGGPEVSHELESQDIVALADHVITGEGDAALPGVLEQVLAGEPVPRVVPGVLPDTKTLALPYDEYSDHDVEHRVVYVEASRGCPFRCEFCLSALDKQVRDIPLERLLPALQRLMDRGVRQFKFIDRTFNLKVESGERILDFFLERWTPGMFLHFEMIPDRLPPTLRERLAAFPEGAVQLEIGVQTFDPEVSRHVSRRQDVAKLEDNFRFLREHTGVHLHADLIVGLPGETLDSFARGFDRLFALRPQEIQVGMLKRLKGTPLRRHEPAFALAYDAAPPFEIRSTSTMDAALVRRLAVFAKFWDLVHNSGEFPATVKTVLNRTASGPFAAFLALSDWLWKRFGRTHALALDTLAEALFAYCQEELGLPENVSGPLVLGDYLRPGGRRVPRVFAPYRPPRIKARPGVPGSIPAAPSRQARHLG